MGGKESSTKEPIDLYLDHPIFKNAKSINIQGKNYMQVHVGSDEKQHAKWAKSIADLKLNKDYLLLPVKEQYSSKGLCGSNGNIKINFDAFPYLLNQEIYNQKGKKKGFQQNQIWYLLYALACAKKSMVPIFSKIGDVRPHNIFLNDKGELKVSNRYSWPRQSPNINKSLDGEVTYLAPEQIKQLQIGRVQNQRNDISEIFSIGLTLLSTALSEDYSKLYNLKSFNFDLEGLKNQLQKLNINPAFSEILKATINNLLEFNIEKRLTPRELWDWISQYDEEIISRRIFIINQAPQKLHQKVLELRNRYVSQQESNYQVINNQIINHPPHVIHEFESRFRSPSREEPALRTSALRTSALRTSALRTSGFSGQKLNFPPPVMRTTILTNGFPDRPNSVSNTIVVNSEGKMIQKREQPLYEPKRSDLSRDSPKK